MDQQKHAAIDNVAEKTLNDISAADFLSALDAGGLSVHSLRVWPEKKKYELYAEPENYGGVKVGVLVRGIAEKKKVEMEKPDLLEDWRFPKRAVREVDFDPRDLLRDPEFIRDLAREVAHQLRNTR